MTLKYAHLAPDHVRKAVEIFDSPKRDLKEMIFDGHYLDTMPTEQENQDVACEA